MIMLLEIEGAFEQFAGGVEEYAIGFGREVIASISPGSIYFSGNDAARGVVAALCKSARTSDPFFTLSQSAMHERGCLHHWRELCGERIVIPSDEDLANCQEQYRQDVQRRRAENKLLPGEFVEEKDGKVQCRGLLADMAVNGLVTRLMFEMNPEREFYFQPEYPLEWMWPYLSPHGLILKLNRQSPVELSEEVVARDRAFWNRRIEPMIGHWLNIDTPAAEVAAFVEKVHVRRELSGFAGDPRFVQNDRPQMLLSRARSSVGRVYHWRAANSKVATEKERLRQEADFAFRQAFALSPRNPQTVFDYVGMQMTDHHFDKAILIGEAAMKLGGPSNEQITSMVTYLKNRTN
jgi:hypothetical protein